MITKIGDYKTKCGEDVKILEIVDGWAIGYWGLYNTAKWCVVTGSFVDGITFGYEHSELSLIEEKKLKLSSEKSEYDNPDQSYLELVRVDKNLIRLAFVDKDGDFKGGGHILSITSDGLVRHTHMSIEFNDYIEMNSENKIRLIEEKDLC